MWGRGLALKYRLTFSAISNCLNGHFVSDCFRVLFHTEVTMYEPRSPLPAPPSPPFGSRFLVTGVGMSEGRVGVVEDDVVVVGVVLMMTSPLVFLGLGV